MKKRRLKPFVKISILGMFLLVCMFSVGILTKKTEKTSKEENNEFTYVNDYIFDSYYPVVNQEEKIKKPYTSDSVSIYKNFYEKDASEEEQQNSIIYHEGIYMQNSGISYYSNEQFDITASLSGTVTNISDDTLLGKTIEIRNSNELIMIYQSLSDVFVKKGDVVTQGQIIGKSGVCTLNSEIKQGLHFEVYKSGQVINPEKIYEKTLKDISEN